MELVTIQRHIADQQRLFREARGDFSALLRQISLAAKLIGAKVRRAGLLNVLGSAGEVNIQGEVQQKLDVLSNEIVKRLFDGIGYVGGIASEEEEGIIRVPEGLAAGNYVVLFDPLDGSSNIDANVSIGTIFSVYRLTQTGRPARMEDFLQRGDRQVAAGYILYGSSTMLVYTAGNGVNGFTLDPTIGEFLLSHEDMRMGETCKVISYNVSNYGRWPAVVRRYIDHVNSGEYPRCAKSTSRYIGSLVADFHRNLLYGGVFLYPEDEKNPKGKLRVLYECNPLAFLAEQAGGAASDGRRRILEIDPQDLHERTPFIVGNIPEVKLYESFWRQEQ